MTRPVLLSLALLAIFGLHRADGDEAGDQIPPEVLQLWKKHELEDGRVRQAAARELDKSRPIVVKSADSLSLRGDGLGGLNNSHGRRHTAGYATVQLESGRLYFETGTDFNEMLFRFYLDKAHPITRELQQRQDRDREFAPLLPKMPAELRKHSESYQELQKQVRTPTDLAAMETLSYYQRFLTGPRALKPEQIERIRQHWARRQAVAEELGKLVQAGAKDRADAATGEKIARLFEEYRGDGQLIGFKDDLLSKEQRVAIGFDPDPNAPPRQPRTSVTAVAASGGAGDADAEAIAKAQKEHEKQQAEAAAREKANREAAQVKFTLKGRDGSSGQQCIHTNDGLLWVYIDALPDASGASYRFYFDAKTTWAVEKAKEIEEYEKYIADLKGKELEDAKKEFEKYKKQIEKVDGYYMQMGHFQLTKLREKTGSVPPDVQKRYDRMQGEMKDALTALTAAYKAATARPDDAALHRPLFEALRTAVKVEKRNQILCVMRDHYDEDGTHEDLAWLLSWDQIDLVSQGSLCTSSSVSSSSNGSLSITARPAGEKQYVSVSVEGMTLGELAEDIQKAARQFYHNHRLQLKVAAGVADKPVGGLVEGKSAEELFQSLARRCGVTVEKDPKTPHAYVLKP